MSWVKAVIKNHGHSDEVNFYENLTTRSWGLVRFEGCSSSFVHFLNPENSQKWTEGASVQAIFKPDDKREGHILDIIHFDLL